MFWFKCGSFGSLLESGQDGGKMMVRVSFVVPTWGVCWCVYLCWFKISDQTIKQGSMEGKLALDQVKRCAVYLCCHSVWGHMEGERRSGCIINCFMCVWHELSFTRDRFSPVSPALTHCRATMSGEWTHIKVLYHRLIRKIWGGVAGW